MLRLITTSGCLLLLWVCLSGSSGDENTSGCDGGVSEETVSGTRRDVGEEERTHRLKDVLVYGPTGSS